MKLLIAVLSLATVAFAQLDVLIEHEVKVIVGANPGITLDQCADICDGLFDLIDAVDEQVSDDMCRSTCDCEINQNCATATQPSAMPSDTTMGSSDSTVTMTTQAPHTTHPHTHHPHPSHPTHPPHPDHGHHG